MPTPTVQYQEIAPYAKLHSTPTMEDKINFCNLDNLKLDGITVGHFATLEPNYWILDGENTILPDDYSHVYSGVVGSTISDENGDFATPIDLVITFSDTQTTPGIEMDFEYFSANSLKNYWPKKIQLIYYRNEDIISDVIFYPDAGKYYCSNSVEHFNKLIIRFFNTSMPKRRVRMNSIYYGITRNFNLDEISSISLYETVNPISSELAINTLDFTLKSQEDLTFLFYKMQPINMYYGENLMGLFFIDTHKRTNKTYTISCVDAIGALDNYTFLGGIYKDASVIDVLDSIISANNHSYTISSDFTDFKITGYIPCCTAREALMQVCFAIGAMVDTSRSTDIKITKWENKTPIVYSEDEAHSNNESNYESVVMGVEVTAYNYTLGTSTSNVYEATLNPGTYRTFTSSPCENYTISGGTITASGVNFVDFEVTTAGKVTISGTLYNDNSAVYSKIDTSINYEVDNIKSVSGCTLINPTNVYEVMDRVYDYVRRIETAKATLILKDNTKPGDTVTIPAVNNETCTGTVIGNTLSFGSKLRGQVEVLAN